MRKRRHYRIFTTKWNIYIISPTPGPKIITEEGAREMVTAMMVND